MVADPRMLFYLGFEVAVLVAYHIPRWLVSATKIWFYEERKGTWTFTRHIHTQMKWHMPNILHKQVSAISTAFRSGRSKQTRCRLQVEFGFLPSQRSSVSEIRAFARDRNIASIPIPGYWIHKNEKVPLESPPSPGERIFYLFHGGGYVSETAHPEGVVSKALKDFLRNSSSPSLRRTFAVKYRLSSSGESGKGSVFSFLTALIDALAGYLYLVKLGFLKENIIVGDSAGANIALALTIYLLSNKEQQPKLPEVPGALVLLSPWADLSDQFMDQPGPSSSLTLNAERDWLTPINRGPVRACAKMFLGRRAEHVELAYRNPYISPASPILLGLTPDSPTRTISLKGFPRTFIDNDRFESFYGQIRRLGDAMAEDLGVEMVAYNEVDGAPHDYLTIDWCDPDRTGTSKKILKWLGL